MSEAPVVSETIKQVLIDRLVNERCPRCDVALRRHRRDRSLYCYRQQCRFKISRSKYDQIMNRHQPTDVQLYKDAVWDYLMEHCEITPSGQYFIKFHTDRRTKFEGHVNARMKGYHRGDPRQQEAKGVELQTQHQETKAQRHERFLKNRARGRRLIFWRKLANKLNPLRFLL